MINVCLYSGDSVQFGGTELINLPLLEGQCIWIDIQQATSQAEQLIFDQFNCHPLTIQDARRVRHPPKTEHFDDQSFVLIRSLKHSGEGLNFETVQLAGFIGSQFLITRHQEDCTSVSTWWSSIQLEGNMARGPFELFASISNSIGLEYLDLILDFEPTLSNYEDTLLTSPSDDLLRDLISCKTWLRKLKRLQGYHEGVYAELRQHLSEQKSDNNELLHSLTDAYEKFERLQSLSSLYYDLVGDLIDGHISLTSHKLNETMRLLTVVTTIFVPLGFLAGLYGMNFDYIPELHFPNGYFFLVGTMAIIAVSLVVIFKRNKWL
jgi:magnesium transporter